MSIDHTGQGIYRAPAEGIRLQRAARLRSAGRSGFHVRYRPLCKDDDLRERLQALARERPRFGYRRLHVSLGEEPALNHKRVFRIYQEAGLAVKRRKRKRLVRVGNPLQPALFPNEEWALDFVSDAIATGRKIRFLNAADAYTRECLALEVDTSFASLRVTRVLDKIIDERGRPDRIRCDNVLNASDFLIPGHTGPVDRVKARLAADSILLSSAIQWSSTSSGPRST